MQTAFETWTYKGTRYIAVPCGYGSVHVVSQDGDSLGRFQSVESARQYQREGKATVLGKAALSARAVLVN